MRLGKPHPAGPARALACTLAVADRTIRQRISVTCRPVSSAGEGSRRNPHLHSRNTHKGSARSTWPVDRAGLRGARVGEVGSGTRVRVVPTRTTSDVALVQNDLLVEDVPLVKSSCPAEASGSRAAKSAEATWPARHQHHPQPQGGCCSGGGDARKRCALTAARD